MELFGTFVDNRYLIYLFAGKSLDGLIQLLEASLWIKEILLTSQVSNVDDDAFSAVPQDFVSNKTDDSVCLRDFSQLTTSLGRLLLSHVVFVRVSENWIWVAALCCGQKTQAIVLFTTKK